jgi:hypothetical protein
MEDRMINTIAITPSRELATTQPESESLMERAMARAARDIKTRWSSYDLPTVTPLSSFADFSAAAAKRREVAIERSACEKELSKAVTAIARGMAARRDEETDRQARDILDGRPEEAFVGFEELRTQVARLTQRQKAYCEALRIQDEHLATIRSERSIDAAASMSAVHRDAAGAIAEAVSQLRIALDREEAIRVSVTQAGYDARLPNFAMPNLFGNNGRFDELERLTREYAR